MASMHSCWNIKDSESKQGVLSVWKYKEWVTPMSLLILSNLVRPKKNSSNLKSKLVGFVQDNQSHNLTWDVWFPLEIFLLWSCYINPSSTHLRWLKMDEMDCRNQCGIRLNIQQVRLQKQHFAHVWVHGASSSLRHRWGPVCACEAWGSWVGMGNIRQLWHAAAQTHLIMSGERKVNAICRS